MGFAIVLDRASLVFMVLYRIYMGFVQFTWGLYSFTGLIWVVNIFNWMFMWFI